MGHTPSIRWQRLLATCLSTGWLIGVLAAMGCRDELAGARSQDQVAPLPPLVFDSSVQTLLDSQLDALESLTNRREILEQVVQSNRRTVDYGPSTIEQLERRWSAASDGGDLVQSTLASAASRVVADFQLEHPEFAEILITDAHGFLVGATNQTSDYYQADESWWVTAYHGGAGERRCGEIDYDQSAQHEGVSLLLPVRDPESARVVGVVKAVYQLQALKAGL